MFDYKKKKEKKFKNNSSQVKKHREEIFKRDGDEFNNFIAVLDKKAMDFEKMYKPYLYQFFEKEGDQFYLNDPTYMKNIFKYTLKNEDTKWDQRQQYIEGYSKFSTSIEEQILPFLKLYSLEWKKINDQIENAIQLTNELLLLYSNNFYFMVQSDESDVDKMFDKHFSNRYFPSFYFNDSQYREGNYNKNYYFLLMCLMFYIDPTLPKDISLPNLVDEQFRSVNVNNFIEGDFFRILYQKVKENMHLFLGIQNPISKEEIKNNIQIKFKNQYEHNEKSYDSFVFIGFLKELNEEQFKENIIKLLIFLVKSEGNENKILITYNKEFTDILKETFLFFYNDGVEVKGPEEWNSKIEEIYNSCNPNVNSIQKEIFMDKQQKETKFTCDPFFQKTLLFQLLLLIFISIQEVFFEFKNNNLLQMRQIDSILSRNFDRSDFDQPNFPYLLKYNVMYEWVLKLIFSGQNSKDPFKKWIKNIFLKREYSGKKEEKNKKRFGGSKIKKVEKCKKKNKMGGAKKKFIKKNRQNGKNGQKSVQRRDNIFNYIKFLNPKEKFMVNLSEYMISILKEKVIVSSSLYKNSNEKNEDEDDEINSSFIIKNNSEMMDNNEEEDFYNDKYNTNIENMSGGSFDEKLTYIPCFLGNIANYLEGGNLKGQSKEDISSLTEFLFKFYEQSILFNKLNQEKKILEDDKKIKLFLYTLFDASIKEHGKIDLNKFTRGPTSQKKKQQQKRPQSPLKNSNINYYLRSTSIEGGKKIKKKLDSLNIMESFSKSGGFPVERGQGRGQGRGRGRGQPPSRQENRPETGQGRGRGRGRGQERGTRREQQPKTKIESGKNFIKELGDGSQKNPYRVVERKNILNFAKVSNDWPKILDIFKMDFFPFITKPEDAKPSGYLGDIYEQSKNILPTKRGNFVEMKKRCIGFLIKYLEVGIMINLYWYQVTKNKFQLFIQKLIKENPDEESNIAKILYTIPKIPDKIQQTTLLEPIGQIKVYDPAKEEILGQYKPYDEKEEKKRQAFEVLSKIQKEKQLIPNKNSSEFKELLRMEKVMITYLDSLK